MNLNKVELIGGVVRPPDLQYTKGGYPHARMTLAVNDTRYSKDEGGQVAVTHYISCQIWGTLAVNLAEVDITKGEKLYVLGSLDQSEYEDKDGNKVSKTRVRVAFVERLEPPEIDYQAPDLPDEEAPF